MHHRITILAAALDLGAFTVDELAARALVPRSTVQTVLTRLNRLAPDWADRRPEPARGRGQPPLRYRLSALGRAQIQAELQPLVAIGSHAQAAEAATSVSEPPMGLALARHTLQELREQGDATGAAGLLSQLKEQLSWAQRELEERPAPERPAHLRAILALQHEAIWMQRPSAPAAQPAPTPAPTPIPMPRQLPRPTPQHAPASTHDAVVVAQLGHSRHVRELRERVSAMLSAGMAVAPFAPDLMPVSAHRLWPQRGADALRLSRAPGRVGRQQMLLLCLNSGDDPATLQRRLRERLSSTAAERVMLLDWGHDHRLAAQARQQRWRYAAHAQHSTDWVRVALGLPVLERRIAAPVRHIGSRRLALGRSG